MKIFKTPFATQGDRVAVPDEMQSDGSVSYTQGYSQDYEKEYDKAGAKDIERSKMNAIFHDITDAIGKGQSTGIYPWIKEAAPYVKGSFVYYNKEAFYSLVDNNSDTPADGAKWRALSKKQDALTFTGTGDVVRKSVTDALDGRVTTAQSSADSALKKAQSKQDKLEFVGSGKVMKEGAGGLLEAFYLKGFDFDDKKTFPGSGFSSHYLNNALNRPYNSDGVFQCSFNSIGYGYGYQKYITPSGNIKIRFFNGSTTSAWFDDYTAFNTRTDKNGVLHATTGTPINTLNVSDMSQSVVNRDDITVTSGAVFRADNALSTRITAAQSKADSAHSLAASKTTEAWVKSVSLGINQNWVDVTSQRVVGTLYRNTTSKPIFVSVTHGESSSNNSLFVDGVLASRGWLDSPSSIWQSVQAIVPPGSTYYVGKSGENNELNYWAELR